MTSLGEKKTCGKDTVKIGKLLLSRVNVLVKPLFDEFFSSFYLMPRQDYSVIPSVL